MSFCHIYSMYVALLLFIILRTLSHRLEGGSNHPDVVILVAFGSNSLVFLSQKIYATRHAIVTGGCLKHAIFATIYPFMKSCLYGPENRIQCPSRVSRSFSGQTGT